MNGSKVIRIDRAGFVAEVVLNNPGRLNAMEPNFVHEVREAFRALDADDSVRAVVVWAEGRIFSSGLNLKEAMGLIPERRADLSDAARNRVLYRTIVDFQDCFNQVRRCRKPTIAAVHGMCIGGGLDLATACDIRLCAADAMFAVHETKMAMVADLGTLQRLTRIVGPGAAREMGFTGDAVGAARAQSIGLVNSVHPDKPALLEAARRMAATIAANSPLATQGVKRVLDFADEHTHDEGLEFVAQWNTNFFLSADLSEALAAFAEKREPRFQGK